MDGSQFDLWTRRRIGFLAGGLFAALLGFTAPADTAARKKRNKKKKRKPETVCRNPGQSCSPTPNDRCCGALVCAVNGCGDIPVCLRDEGGSCNNRCDCLTGLECSDRAGDTCQQCVVLQNPCESDDVCCLLSAACGSTIYGSGVCCQQPAAACAFDSDCCLNTGFCRLNGCGGIDTVCCRGAGATCGSNCDCCDPLRCVGPGSTCQ